jgi:DNA-binding response OmpR family regulator
MKKSVLVVEDETDLCEFIAIVLHKEGFIVDCAFSLAEAAQKLHRHPDIVLLDNQLPDGTGLEYLQMHPADFMDSVIVMISSDTSQELQKGASFEGIEAFLPKPFSMYRMKETIRQSIRSAPTDGLPS